MTTYLDTWSHKSKAGEIPFLDWVKIQRMKKGFENDPSFKDGIDPTLISGLDPTKLALATDISHWQGTVDFRTLHNDGKVSMIFPKASDGKQVRAGGEFEITNYIDDKLYANVQGCYDNTTVCGPYHYAQVDYGVGSEMTVKNMVDKNWNSMVAAFNPLVPKKSYHAVVLDVEERGGSEPNRSDVIMGLIQRIKNDAKMSQVKHIIYSSNYLLNTFYPNLMNQITSSTSTWGIELWLAQWVYTTYTKCTWAEFWSRYLPAIDMRVLVPGVRGVWKFVQYSSAFELPGCAGRMDVNAYAGDEAHLYSWLGYTSTTPPPEPPPSTNYATQEQLAATNARVTTLEGQAHPKSHTHPVGDAV